MTNENAYYSWGCDTGVNPIQEASDDVVEKSFKFCISKTGRERGSVGFCWPIIVSEIKNNRPNLIHLLVAMKLNGETV